jgi:hypothetical protein
MEHQVWHPLAVRTQATAMAVAVAR